MIDFADLIRPLALSDFLDEFWDRQFFHDPADPGQDRAKWFDLAQFDALLSRPSLSATNLFAIDARRTLGPGDYSHANGDSDVLRVLDLFDAGATVVFREADRHHHGLWRLTRAIERALEAPAFANIYYAPAGGQSFPTHYDALDVFAVQLSGCKVWSLFAPIGAKPLRHDHCYDDLGNSGEQARITLRAGDVLYIPRGQPHLVTAGDEPSLHISISVTPFTRYDLLRSQLDVLARSDGDHRVALAPSAGPIDDSPATAVTLPQGEDLARMRHAALLAQVPVAIDQPLRARALARSLNANTMLQAVIAAPCYLEPAEDHVRLLGNGRALGFTLQARPALDHALSGDVFAIGALPGLDDDEARCDLAATLLTNGFVETVSASPA